MQIKAESSLLVLLRGADLGFHSDNCYVIRFPATKVAENFSQFFFALMKTMPVQNQHQVFIARESFLTFRLALRQKAPSFNPGKDFYLKILPVKRDYVLSFFDELLEGRAFPKRTGPRGRYTNTGKGTFSRRSHPDVLSKGPQYSLAEKSGFSKIQSSSLILQDKNYHPELFGLEKNWQVLAGCIFDVSNVLLSDRHFIFDADTHTRSYDSNDLDSARKYYQENRHRLYHKDNYSLFQKAMLENQNANKHNESLVRLRWSPDNRLFIGSDLLETRLLIKAYATFLEKKLHYPVPICFYTPDNAQWMYKSYADEEYMLDYLEARWLCSIREIKSENFRNGHFSLLSVLKPDELLQELLSAAGGYSLAIHMLNKGYVQLLKLFILNADLCPGQVLQGLDQLDADLLLHIFTQVIRGRDKEFYALVLSHLPDFAVQPMEIAEIIIYMIKNNDQEWIDRLLVLPWLDPDIRNATDESLATALVAMGNHHGLQLLMGRGWMNPDETDNHGKTLLYIAAEHGHLEMVRLLLEKGADVRRLWKNKSPMAVAIENKDAPMLSLFERYSGLEINEPALYALPPQNQQG